MSAREGEARELLRYSTFVSVSSTRSSRHDGSGERGGLRSGYLILETRVVSPRPKPDYRTPEYMPRVHV